MGQVESVAAYEVVREALEPLHGVAGTDAGHAFVRLDEDERGLEGGARARVPGCDERRIERKSTPLDADPRDLHRPRRKNALAGLSRWARTSSSLGSPAAPRASDIFVASNVFS